MSEHPVRMPLKYALNTREWCDCSLKPRPEPSWCAENCALVTGHGVDHHVKAGDNISEEEKEAQRIYEEKYGQVIQAPHSSLEFTKQSAVIITGSDGETIVPDFRDFRCTCKRKFRIYLAQKKPVPVWAGTCPRCHGHHWRGEADAVSIASDSQLRRWLKKAKETKRHGTFVE